LPILNEGRGCEEGVFWAENMLGPVVDKQDFMQLLICSRSVSFYF